ncbi:MULTISPECIES: hypothetical protein [unclassified Psychrobacter]|uniref:hypothetical protein n=1 Tax=unclassified Psychrobacter TaxID=196806 RepID=UPI003FD15E78
MISSGFNVSRPYLKSLLAGALFASLIVTGGCQLSAESNMATSSNNASTNSDMSQQTLIQQAMRIQRALANNDYARVADDIHPTRGVRFSMYAYIQPESDKVFSREQYTQYLDESNVRFTWGQKDGTGDIYVTPLPDYLKDWVKADYFNDQSTTTNATAAVGNSINNLDRIYPNSEYVEFYNPGVNPEYGGLDWRALRLVFDEYQGRRYLVAVISDQWTT